MEPQQASVGLLSRDRQSNVFFSPRARGARYLHAWKTCQSVKLIASHSAVRRRHSAGEIKAALAEDNGLIEHWRDYAGILILDRQASATHALLPCSLGFGSEIGSCIFRLLWPTVVKLCGGNSSRVSHAFADQRDKHRSDKIGWSGKPSCKHTE